jgi:hypothetical protein
MGVLVKGLRDIGSIRARTRDIFYSGTFNITGGF